MPAPAPVAALAITRKATFSRAILLSPTFIQPVHLRLAPLVSFKLLFCRIFFFCH